MLVAVGVGWGVGVGGGGVGFTVGGDSVGDGECPGVGRAGCLVVAWPAGRRASLVLACVFLGCADGLLAGVVAGVVAGVDVLALGGGAALLVVCAGALCANRVAKPTAVSALS